MVSYLPSPSTPPGDCSANQDTPGLLLTWILLAIATLVVSLRLYIRAGLRKNAGEDDYVALVSLIVGIVCGAFFTKMITSGMGKHVSCLSAESVVSMLEFSAVSEALNVIGIGIVKISVCLTLLRIIDRARKKISQFLWVLLAFVAVTHFVLALVFFLHCRPLPALWNPQIHGHCMSTHSTVIAGYAGFAVDIITDLICAGIPLFVIHRLKMNFRAKVVLCILMGLGVFTAGCAVAKAVTLRGVFADDYTWGFTKPATWAAVEQFVGIIIASVPALRPLFTSFREKIPVKDPESRPKPKNHIFWAGKSIKTTGIRRNNDNYDDDDDDQIRKAQSRASHSSIAEGIRNKLKQVTWNTESRDATLAGRDSLDTTVTASERRMSWTNESFVEKALIVPVETSPSGQEEGNSADQNTKEEVEPDRPVRNHLSMWSLPDIGDRRSGLFSIPYLDPSRISWFRYK